MDMNETDVENGNDVACELPPALPDVPALTCEHTHDFIFTCAACSSLLYQLIKYVPVIVVVVLLHLYLPPISAVDALCFWVICL